LTAFWYTPNGLAIILTIGAIGIIAGLVAIHQTTVLQNHQTYTEMFNKLTTNVPTNSQSTKDLFESFQNYYREVNASNTNLLSILLPVIGAWVGAILAFYYGNKNMDKITESIKAAATLPYDEEKLANMKVDDILDKFPEYKEVVTAKISESVGACYSKIPEKATNLLLLDDSDRPLGIIYKTDFTRNTARKEEQIRSEAGSFANFFTSMINAGTPIKDIITEQIWTSNGLDKGKKNYAHIDKNDNLLQARIKMREVSQRQEMKGVILEGDKVLGIITYELFSNVLAQEQLHT